MFFGASLGAERLSVPATLPLTSNDITLELAYADLDLTIQADAEPSLQAKAFDAEGNEITSELQMFSKGGKTVIERQVDGNSKPDLIELRLVLTRQQKLRVTGLDLRLTARDTLLDPTTQGATGPSRLEVEAERSDINLQGLVSPFLDVKTSVLHLEDCQGDLAIRLDQSQAKVVGACGSLKLIGKDSDFAVHQARGPIKLSFDLRQSLLDVFMTDLQGQGSASGGSVSFSEWQGRLTLEVDQAQTSLSTTSSTQPELTLKAQHSDIIVDGLRGKTFVKLAGGTLHGRGLGISTQVTAVGEAVVQLEDSEGAIKVSLSDRSRATLVDLRGQVHLAVTDGSAEAERITHLKIEAIRAEVSAAQITRQEAVILTDSQVNLDLVAAQEVSALILRGQSFAQVRLSQPCLVRLSTLSTLLDDQVKVEGCELPLVNVGKHPAVRDPQTLVLTASLRDSGRLEVEGVER